MAGRRVSTRERPLPARPYRDTVVVYGIMAVILVAIAGLTGGSLLRALVVGTGFFVIATSWSWWRFRTRIREREALEPTEPRPAGDRVDEKDEPGSRKGGANGAVNGNGKRNVGGEQ